MLLTEQCTEQGLEVAPVEHSQELIAHVSWNTWIASSLYQGENHPSLTHIVRNPPTSRNKTQDGY